MAISPNQSKKHNPGKRVCSIAEARNRLAALVHDVERGTTVELTRRGRPVAVVLGLRDYEVLIRGRKTFAEAFRDFRKGVDIERLEIDPGMFEGLREGSPGREVRL